MPTLEEAIDIYLKVDRSPYTTRSYRRVLITLSDAVGGKRNIERVTYEDMLDYTSGLKGSVKASSLGTYVATIKAFFRWCVRRKYLTQSPVDDIMIRQGRGESPAPAVPADELRRMVETARATSRRNYALLLFMIDTGCRVGGLVSLTLDNLHIDERYALLREKGNKLQRVFFGDRTAEALSLWLQHRPAVIHGFVWTSSAQRKYAPLGTFGVRGVLKTLSQLIEASRVWNPHAVRHSVGHAMAKNGLPASAVQMKLGHASSQTTVEFYFPRDEPYLRQIVDEYPLLPLEDQPNKPAPASPKIIQLLPKRRRP
jgi:site-specific recombinase XerD